MGLAMAVSASTSMAVPLVSIRGTEGVRLVRGPRFEPVAEFIPDVRKCCRLTAWSSNGQYFAWANGSLVNVVNTDDWSLVAQLPRPKTCGLQFSPKQTYLTTWEPYAVTKDTPVNTPNLHIWNIKTKESIKSYVQKRNTGWEPSWSSDEKLLARNLNLELQVYETDKMEGISYKSQETKINDFSISPGTAPYHFLCYTPGSKGQPAFAKLFQYPNFNPAAVIATKSFFHGDKVEMKWNKNGNCVLLMTSTDVDVTGASYYGKQTLHFLNTKGDSLMVQLPKEGPIYSVEWNPRGNEFCVVYGFMPAKATLFNIKCEPKFDFGTGPRNCVFFNPFGNLLLLGGFGNLRGKIEVWDNKTFKLIAPIDAPDTTHLQWCPDGQHFMTSTTAPRLRVDNGAKVWHYSGSLIHEYRITQKTDELWETTWQTLPLSSFEEFVVSSKKVQGIVPSQPQVSKELYRPPCARGTQAVIKFLEERELPSNPKAPVQSEMGKNAVKNKKKQQRKEKKESQDKTKEDTAVIVEVNYVSDLVLELTGDPEVDKQLKDLKKKLDQIGKLKAEKAAGKTMELNQVEKLGREEEFRKQLEKLTLGKK